MTDRIVYGLISDSVLVSKVSDSYKSGVIDEVFKFVTLIEMGAWIVKGNWDGSTNVFPNVSVKKGYQYFNTANTTTLLMPDGGIIPAGAIIVARVDNPGQVVTNWYYLLSVVGEGTDWLLATKFWNDNGIWDDTATWID